MKISQDLLGKLENMNLDSLQKIQNYYHNNPEVLKSCQDISNYIKSRIEFLKEKEKSRV